MTNKVGVSKGSDSMIYVTCVTKNSRDEIIEYKGFDTCTESPITLSKELLIQIISNTTIKVVNVSIKDNSIVIKEWANGIASKGWVSRIVGHTYKGPKYVIWAKGDSEYRLADYYGNTTKVQGKDLKTAIEQNEIANCTIVEGKIKMEDVYENQRNVEFSREIELKYNNFIAKALMVGYGDVQFEYEIFNSEVRLVRYNGSSLKVILPPFITAIKNGAFDGKGIKTVKLNPGLQAIGAYALASNELERIEIPETVELIEVDAFAYNSKLFSSRYGLNMDRVKLQSDKTIILNK